MAAEGMQLKDIPAVSTAPCNEISNDTKDEQQATNEKSENGTFSRAVEEFSQSTTFHGVKYITQSDTTVHRRLLWLVAWTTAVALLALLIHQKLTLLYSYPSSVEIWDEHVQSLDFPALTICNKNLYRLSQVHKQGWYDAVRIMTGSRTQDYEGFYYNESVCTVPTSAHFTHTVVSASVNVCQRLCSDSDFYDLQCSGFFWQRDINTCTLTSYTGDAETAANGCRHGSGRLNKHQQTMYFRRLRQLRNKPLYCTFDDDVDTGACPLTPDRRLPDVWKVMEAMDRQWDVTIGYSSRHGRVLSLITSSASYGQLARVVTPLMRTTDKCLMFFYRQTIQPKNNTLIRLTAVRENLDETLLGEYNSSTDSDWQRVFIRLPWGEHWLALSASGQGHLEAYVDDLSVRSCQDFSRNCLLSGDGKEYMGDAEAVFEVEHCACATGWFRCQNAIGCVPRRMLCNDYYDCDDGSDEFEWNCKQNWSELTEQQQRSDVPLPLLGRPDEDVHLRDASLPVKWTSDFNESQVWQSLIDDSSLKMSQFVRMTANDMRNTIAKCQWQNATAGNSCQDGVNKGFVEHLTDMGLCYRFNAIASAVLQSNRVGEKDSGLYLVINSESYEALRDVGSSAQLKIVLFDPATDEEIVWDQGIHISPGFYTAVSLSLEQLVYLEAPFGTCGSIPLNHTSGNVTYSHSRCIRDRQTDEFVQRRGCKNYFMPGEGPECSVQQFFSTSISGNQTIGHSSNKNDSDYKTHTTLCPSHCKQKVYDAKLTMSALSLANFMESVDTEVLDELQRHLTAVRNIHSRVDVQQMLPFLRTFSSISFLAAKTVRFIEETLLKTARPYFDLVYDLETVDGAGNWWKQHLEYLGKIHSDALDFHTSYRLKDRQAVSSYLHWLATGDQHLISFCHLFDSESFRTAEQFSLLIQLAKSALHSTELTSSMGGPLTRKYQNKTTNFDATQRACYPLQNAKCFGSLEASIEISRMVNLELQAFLSEVSILNSSSYTETLMTYMPTLHSFAANLSDSYDALQKCIVEHEKVIERVIQAADVSDIQRQLKVESDTLSALLIADTLGILRRVQQSVGDTLSDFLNNAVTRQVAGDKLMSLASEISACVENTKYFVNNRMHSAWPEEVLAQQRDAVVEFSSKALGAVRALNVQCRKQWEAVSSTHEFASLITATSSLHRTYHKWINYLPDWTVFPRQAARILGMLAPNETDVSKRFAAQFAKEEAAVSKDESDEALMQYHFVHRIANKVLQRTSALHDEWQTQLRSLEHVLEDVRGQIEEYNRSLLINDRFVRENIAVVKIYFSGMKVKRTEQNVAYGWASFFSDLGGSLGLLLGGSVLSLIEVIDVFFRNIH